MDSFLLCLWLLVVKCSFEFSTLAFMYVQDQACVTLAQALTSNHDTLSILDGDERHDISHFQSVVYLAVVNRVISRVTYQTELALGAVG